MWNGSLPERDLMAALSEQIRNALPLEWSVRVDVLGGPKQPDGYIELHGPDGRIGILVIEAKSRLEPKQIPSIIRQLRSLSSHPPMVVAPFISQTTQERLIEAGASYADSTGNLRLVLSSPAIFLSAQGATKDSNRDKRLLQSLKGPAAADVIRNLCEWRPPYGVREFAQRTGVPLGTVSRVADLLDRDGLIEKDEKGHIVSVDWERIIRRWVTDYKVLEAHDIRRFFEPRGTSALLDKLRKSRATYCVTGSLAAADLAPIASSRLTMIYAHDSAQLAESLGLRPNETNPNVIMLHPRSRSPFQRTRSVEGVVYAAPCQVAADLFQGPGRSIEEAEALLKWMKSHEDDWRQHI